MRDRPGSCDFLTPRHHDGGRIGVEANQAKEALVHFTRVPFADAPGKTPQAIDAESLLGLPVLVVDDNATNLRILSEMLEGWLMQPAQAASGRQALAILEQRRAMGTPFPLVLVDS